ncbi:hypothetical protein [Paenibacillus polymyxa]|uniref:hypothetical protein n=1 Tax=Paenibacillus polymyxa TaxID=1406 RepID=UPI0004B0D3A5|nr:hypothetical protein [Paenibacillus polymyxa]
MIEDDTFYIWGEEYIISKILSGKGIKLEEQFLFVFNRIEQTKHNLMMGALSMNKDDEKLLQYYLELKRDYVKKTFDIIDEIQVCNVGIGTRDWDDYLGYWLKGRGGLPSLILTKVFARYLSIDNRGSSIRIHQKFYAGAYSIPICLKNPWIL